MPVATLDPGKPGRRGGTLDHANISCGLHHRKLHKDIVRLRASEVFLNSLSMSAIAAGGALLWSFCVAGLIARKGKRHWKRLL